MTAIIPKSSISILLLCYLLATGCNNSNSEEKAESNSLDIRENIETSVAAPNKDEKVSKLSLMTVDTITEYPITISAFSNDSTKERISFCYCKKIGKKGFKVQLYSGYSTQEDINLGYDRVYNLIIERKKNEDFRAQFRFLSFEIQDGRLVDAYIIAKSTEPELSGKFLRKTEINYYEMELSTFKNHPLSDITGTFKFEYDQGEGYFEWDSGVQGAFKCINHPPQSDDWIANWNIQEWYKSL